MKNTTEKEPNALLPIPLIRSIHEGVRSYEVTRFSDPRPCQDDGETDYHKHDTRITENSVARINRASNFLWSCLEVTYRYHRV